MHDAGESKARESIRRANANSLSLHQQHQQHATHTEKQRAMATHLPAPSARLSTTSAGGDSTTASSVASASASAEAPPRAAQKFNLDLFRPALKKLLHANLAGSAWDKDKEAQKKLTRALADAVKGKMLGEWQLETRRRGVLGAAELGQRRPSALGGCLESSIVDV